ncbi:MAG TPA: exonuclease [Anaeromyxobacteraceae bacterium]|nr:exonuclease [Anaeromyxobacteraceae bacterium]
MSLIVVDVEADGPAPHLFSMVSFGAVVVEPSLGQTFKGEVRPVSERWDPQALAISGVSREQHLRFEEPGPVMERFEAWLAAHSKGKPVFCSDNLAFDWQWVNYYFHAYLGRNPFGWSGRRIGDLYCGMMKDGFATWKHLRPTAHDHDPVNDARANAGVLLRLIEQGLKLPAR